MIAHALASAALLMSPTLDAVNGPSLRDRLEAIDRSGATPTSCLAHVAQAPISNGPDLFVGSSVCALADQPVEASFLLNAAQTRSTVDMSLMVPATRADSDRVLELYGLIYAGAGGPGSEDVLGSPALRQRFLSLYDAWAPVYGPHYTPGWNARRTPEASAYGAAIEEVRAARRRQLIEIATLYSDEAYSVLHRRIQELQRRTSGTYHEGTPEAELARELQRQMSERATALGIGGRSPSAEVDPSEIEFPPPAPGPDEVVTTTSTDPAIRRCQDLVERVTIAFDTQVVRVLVTRSPKWGVIWRADVAGAGEAPTRHTCTATSSSSHPLDMGGETLAPLPSGPDSPAWPRLGDGPSG
jgi:hypothetical protein